MPICIQNNYDKMRMKRVIKIIMVNQSVMFMAIRLRIVHAALQEWVS